MTEYFPNSLKISAIQMHCLVNDKKNNISNAIKHIESAVKTGSRLIVLPELFSMGYSCLRKRKTEFFDEAEPIPGPTTKAIGEKAKEHKVFIVAPIYEKAGHGLYYNTAVFFGPNGKIIGKYSKTHVPLSEGGSLEKYYFRPGSNFPVFKTEVGNIGILICYDRLFPEPFRILTLKGADLIIVPSTIFPREIPTVSHDWNFVAKTRAVENGVFAVFVNRSGEENGLKYFGHSLIVDPNGKTVAQAGFDECILTANIDLDEIDSCRKRRVYMRDRRPEIYNKIIEYM
jgi:N-carbamoylputrescine amidase